MCCFLEDTIFSTIELGSTFVNTFGVRMGTDCSLRRLR